MPPKLAKKSPTRSKSPKKQDDANKTEASYFASSLNEVRLKIIWKLVFEYSSIIVLIEGQLEGIGCLHCAFEWIRRTLHWAIRKSSQKWFEKKIHLVF